MARDLLTPGAPARRQLAATLRRLGLIGLADAVAWRLGARAAAADNAAWRAANPGVPAPPDALLFEVTGQSHVAAYVERGRLHAQAIADIARSHGAAAPRAVLEWGCGPGRVLSHLPDVWPDASLTGIDINDRAIRWASRAVPSARFVRIAPEPPTALASGGFDLIYAISVLTHLSPERSARWMEELRRLAAPGGLVVLTTYALGEAETNELGDGVAVLAGAPEGARTYVARHSSAAMRAMCAGRFEVLAHLTDGPAGVIGQAAWVLRAGP
jgi:SAM-dependent methyltransferase